MQAEGVLDPASHLAEAMKSKMAEYRRKHGLRRYYRPLQPGSFGGRNWRGRSTVRTSSRRC